MGKYNYCMLFGFILGTMSFFLTSCTHKLCESEQSLIIYSSNIIGDVLDCKHPEKLRPYISKFVKKMSLCKKDLYSELEGSIICELIINDIFEYGLSSIPIEAECSGGSITEVARKESILWCGEIFYK